MDEKFKKILTDVNPEILDCDGLDLIDDDIIDSLMIMQIVSMSESAFGIDFDPEDINPENFSSAEKIWEVIQKYVVNKQ